MADVFPGFLMFFFSEDGGCFRWHVHSVPRNGARFGRYVFRAVMIPCRGVTCSDWGGGGVAWVLGHLFSNIYTSGKYWKY